MWHDAWLSRGGVPFERLDVDRQSEVSADYDSRSLLRIRPARDSMALMERHSLRLLNEPGGLLVGARLAHRQGGGPMVMQRPPEPGFRLRLLLFLTEPAMLNYSNLPFISGGGFYRFGTGSGNVDPLGAHLSARLQAFDESVQYRIGDAVVDDADDPGQRALALSDTGPGQRQPKDWVFTKALSDAVLRQSDQIQQGKRIRHDGFVHEALIDNPGNDLSVETDWRRLFPVSLQGVSQRDRRVLRPARFEIDIAAADASRVQLELRDEKGRHLGWSRFAAPEPDAVQTVMADLVNRPPGLYRLRVTDDDGRLLEQASGQPLAGADQTVYVDDEAAREGAFGVLEIAADDPGYELLNQNGTLRSPTFMLRFISRLTTWRYHFPRDLTPDQVAAIRPELVQEGARILRTAEAHPLGGDFVDLGRFDSGQLLPNPSPNRPPRLIDGRLVTDLYLNH